MQRAALRTLQLRNISRDLSRCSHRKPALPIRRVASLMHAEVTPMSLRHRAPITAVRLATACC